MGYVFANPEFLYLLFLLIPLVFWYVWQEKKQVPVLQVSSDQAYRMHGNTWRVKFRHAIFVLRALLIALLIFILARPQSSEKWHDEVTEGIDIVISLDVSTSMLAMDFKPNRIDAAKEIAIDFISGRPNDRMGLVIFAGESFTQCPLTTDHSVVINLMNDVRTGLLEDGTAIGHGIATAVNRLRESEAKSKVVILLTDGENNMGEVSPVMAAEIAKNYGVRIYTVGVGSHGTAPYPFETPFGRRVEDIEVKIDEDMLRQVANMTEGAYFRATDNKKLEEIYKEIDMLEKTKIDVQQYSHKYDEYWIFALIAGALLLLELLLRNTVLRTIP